MGNNDNKTALLRLGYNYPDTEKGSFGHASHCCMWTHTCKGGAMLAASIMIIAIRNIDSWGAGAGGSSGGGGQEELTGSQVSCLIGGPASH